MIEPKKKPCKGTGKAKESGCGQITIRRKYGLCMTCYPKWLYSTPEGKKMVERLTIKATEPSRELQKAFKEKKDRNKLQYLLMNTMIVCHKYIRERDKGKPCVSCGQLWGKDHQAGHWKKAELYSTLKFFENNIHNQCQGCNLMKDGNVQRYADRITMRITEQEKQEIEQMCIDERQSNFKWDRQELEELRTYYNEKYKIQKQINSLT